MEREGNLKWVGCKAGGAQIFSPSGKHLRGQSEGEDLRGREIASPLLAMTKWLKKGETKRKKVITIPSPPSGGGPRSKKGGVKKSLGRDPMFERLSKEI